jgi:hypothetical protein
MRQELPLEVPAGRDFWLPLRLPHWLPCFTARVADSTEGLGV